MRGKVALFVAIVLGIAAILGMRSILQKERQQLTDKMRPVEVVKAARRIERGETITSNMIDPEPAVISEFNVDQDHVFRRDRGYIVGQVANVPIERGQVIKWSYLQREERRLTVQLPPGMVALTIPVDAVSGVAGNIRPGSRVDILGTFTLPPSGAATGAETRTLRMLTHVVVLAVDNRTTLDLAAESAMSDPRPYSTVTLAVTAEESVILTFARTQQAALTLAIRNTTDALTPEPQPVDLTSVIAAARKANELRRAATERAADEAAPAAATPAPPTP